MAAARATPPPAGSVSIPIDVGILDEREPVGWPSGRVSLLMRKREKRRLGFGAAETFGPLCCSLEQISGSQDAEICTWSQQRIQSGRPIVVGALRVAPNSPRRAPLRLWPVSLSPTSELDFNLTSRSCRLHRHWLFLRLFASASDSDDDDDDNQIKPLAPGCRFASRFGRRSGQRAD